MVKKFNVKKMLPPFNMNKLLKLIGILLIVVIVYMLIKRFIFRESFQNSSPSASPSASSTATIMFFSADWCPHCQKAKPEWQAVKSKMDGTSVKGNTLVFTEVDCTAKPPSADTQALMTKYGVQGFPTIVLVKNGTPTTLEGKPTQESISTFINATL
jgi:thiol-disulfide isomerase/thioredoxin